jgi:hypothetical protein
MLAYFKCKINSVFDLVRDDLRRRLRKAPHPALLTVCHGAIRTSTAGLAGHEGPRGVARRACGATQERIGLNAKCVLIVEPQAVWAGC